MIIALLVLILFAILFPKLLRAIVFVVLALVVFELVHASAQDDGPPLPAYDVNANCSRPPSIKQALNLCDLGEPRDACVARMIPVPENAVTACVEMEQKSYNELRIIWDGLLPITRLRALDMVARDYQEYQEGTTSRYRYWSLLAHVLARASTDEELARQARAKQGFRP